MDGPRNSALAAYVDPPLDFAAHAKDCPGGPVRPSALPSYPTHPPKFMLKPLASWAAMRFRLPKLA